MTGFLDHLHEPEPHCSCGHHEGSHCHGFSNQSCMWCDCRSFEDTDTIAETSVPRVSGDGRRLSRR